MGSEVRLWGVGGAGQVSSDGLWAHPAEAAVGRCALPCCVLCGRRQNVHDIFLAGGDTTASTISACAFEVLTRPHVKERVLAELQVRHTPLPLKLVRPTAC
jgi:hypothetical protein